MPDPREDLLQIFWAAIERVSAEKVTFEWLNENSVGSTDVVAIGKAACGMMKGAMSALGQDLNSGLIITSPAYAEDAPGNDRLSQVFSAHPVPDASSLKAGETLIDFVNSVDTQNKVLFLISGGTSSMVEVLADSVSLMDLQDLNKKLLAEGADIGEINQRRAQLSAIKGGKLSGFLNGSEATVLYISDVKNDWPGVVGSGLLYDSGLDPLNNIPHHLVGSLSMAMEGAGRKASALGYKVTIEKDYVEGHALEVGKKLASRLIDATPGVYIFGGETTVELPENPGRGGRNQHLCLGAAQVLDGHDDYYFLAAGTDGIDGNTLDAGGLVDGGTAERSRLHDFPIEKGIVEANANAVLAASGDLIHTGATGTNVTDILIGLKL